ncbi:MAG: adenosine deaminase [Anaerolineae bacterium]|nr:adenosine deaminase [Anaerolineae bacterium]
MEQTDKSLHGFIRDMPKVELHVHLEGSIRPATLLALAERNGVSLPARDLEGVRELYCFTDFDHFIRTYFLISGCLKTAADYDLIAYEFGVEMARQRIRYAEVTFTPYTNVAYTGLPFDEIMAGLNEGRARAQAELGVEFRWVLDIVRNDPHTRHEVAHWAASAMDRGVVGFGLGGTERGYPPELFADAYAVALEAGLHSVPHAGEVVGPESVWGAIRVLKAERIGHGVRSVEDPALIDYLRERQIPLEVCPTSNLCLGGYRSYEEHPVRWLWDQGLYVTVNSDDPPMFNTDLVSEYQALAEHLGFTVGELERLSLNALRVSFLPAGRKAAIEREFVAEFARLRERDHLEQRAV